MSKGTDLIEELGKKALPISRDVVTYHRHANLPSCTGTRYGEPRNQNAARDLMERTSLIEPS